MSVFLILGDQKKNCFDGKFDTLWQLLSLVVDHGRLHASHPGNNRKFLMLTS